MSEMRWNDAGPDEAENVCLDHPEDRYGLIVNAIEFMREVQEGGLNTYIAFQPGESGDTTLEGLRDLARWYSEEHGVDREPK